MVQSQMSDESGTPDPGWRDPGPGALAPGRVVSLRCLHGKIAAEVEPVEMWHLWVLLWPIKIDDFPIKTLKTTIYFGDSPWLC